MDDDDFPCTQLITDENFIESGVEDNEALQIGMLQVIGDSKKGIPSMQFPVYKGENIIGKKIRLDFSFPKFQLINLGRKMNCTISIPFGGSLSKRHAVIEAEANTSCIYDCGSSNRTKVNNMVLKPNVKYPLTNDASIVFGNVKCLYIQNVQKERERIMLQTPNTNTSFNDNTMPTILATETPESNQTRLRNTTCEESFEAIPESQPVVSNPPMLGETPTSSKTIERKVPAILETPMPASSNQTPTLPICTNDNPVMRLQIDSDSDTGDEDFEFQVPASISNASGTAGDVSYMSQNTTKSETDVHFPSTRHITLPALNQEIASDSEDEESMLQNVLQTEPRMMIPNENFEFAVPGTSPMKMTKCKELTVSSASGLSEELSMGSEHSQLLSHSQKLGNYPDTMAKQWQTQPMISHVLNLQDGSDSEDDSMAMMATQPYHGNCATDDFSAINTQAYPMENQNYSEIHMCATQPLTNFEDRETSLPEDDEANCDSELNTTSTVIKTHKPMPSKSTITDSKLEITTESKQLKNQPISTPAAFSVSTNHISSSTPNKIKPQRPQFKSSSDRDSSVEGSLKDTAGDNFVFEESDDTGKQIANSDSLQPSTTNDSYKDRIKNKESLYINPPDPLIVEENSIKLSRLPESDQETDDEVVTEIQKEIEDQEATDIKKESVDTALPSDSVASTSSKIELDQIGGDVVKSSKVIKENLVSLEIMGNKGCHKLNSDKNVKLASFSDSALLDNSAIGDKSLNVSDSLLQLSESDEEITHVKKNLQHDSDAGKESSISAEDTTSSRLRSDFDNMKTLVLDEGLEVGTNKPVSIVFTPIKFSKLKKLGTDNLELSEKNTEQQEDNKITGLSLSQPNETEVKSPLIPSRFYNSQPSFLKKFTDTKPFRSHLPNTQPRENANVESKKEAKDMSKEEAKRNPGTSVEEEFTLHISESSDEHLSQDEIEDIVQSITGKILDTVDNSLSKKTREIYEKDKQSSKIATSISSNTAGSDKNKNSDSLSGESDAVFCNTISITDNENTQACVNNTEHSVRLSIHSPNKKGSSKNKTNTKSRSKEANKKHCSSVSNTSTDNDNTQVCVNNKQSSTRLSINSSSTKIKTYFGSGFKEADVAHSSTLSNTDDENTQVCVDNTQCSVLLVKLDISDSDLNKNGEQSDDVSSTKRPKRTTRRTNKSKNISKRESKNKETNNKTPMKTMSTRKRKANEKIDHKENKIPSTSEEDILLSQTSTVYEYSALDNSTTVVPSSFANKQRKSLQASNNNSEKEFQISTKSKRLTRNARESQDTAEEYKIIFTGVMNTAAENAVKTLGGTLVTDVTQATHLVTDKMRRTVKFLCAVARGLVIANVDWLLESKKKKRFLPTFPYRIEGYEPKYNDDSTPKTGLFEDHVFHITASVLPPKEQMKAIIKCAGGNVNTRMHSARTVAHSKTLVVIATATDKAKCQPALKAGIPVVTNEFILTGILLREIDFEKHALFSFVDGKDNSSVSSKEPTANPLDETVNVLPESRSTRSSARLRKRKI